MGSYLKSAIASSFHADLGPALLVLLLLPPPPLLLILNPPNARWLKHGAIFFVAFTTCMPNIVSTSDRIASGRP